jgi:hypothetical protein
VREWSAEAMRSRLSLSDTIEGSIRKMQELYDFLQRDIFCIDRSREHELGMAITAARSQQHGTCYAEAAAGLVIGALMRRVGSTLPDMEDLVREAIRLGAERDFRSTTPIRVFQDGQWIDCDPRGYHGGEVLDTLARSYKLHTRTFSGTPEEIWKSAQSALAAGRSLYGTFSGYDSFWREFQARSSQGIIQQIPLGTSSGPTDPHGAHAVLVYSEGFDENGIPFFSCRNSWGDNNHPILREGREDIPAYFGEGMGPGLRVVDTNLPTLGFFRTGEAFRWDRLVDVYFTLQDCSLQEKTTFNRYLEQTDRIVYLEFDMRSYDAATGWNPTTLRGETIAKFNCPIGVTVNSTHSGRRVASSTTVSRTYHEELEIGITLIRYQSAVESLNRAQGVLTFFELVLTGRYPYGSFPVMESFRYGTLRKNDPVLELSFPNKIFALPQEICALLQAHPLPAPAPLPRPPR